MIGVAFGIPGRPPTHVIACPDPLDRADVAARLQPLRDALLVWLDEHQVTQVTDERTRRTKYVTADAPQLLVAGADVLTALSHLAYDWRYNPKLDERWHRLGEELWALSDQRHQPGQALVVPLAETLAQHYAFDLSRLEEAKLAVSVALLDAGVKGVSNEQLRFAHRAESGPHGNPDALDKPVWLARQSGADSAPVVHKILEETWDRCSRAWAHVTGIPEAQCATTAAGEACRAWADRIGPVRTGGPRRRRRAQPALASAAVMVARLERAWAKFEANAAQEDPMIAAEMAAEGKAVRAKLAFTVHQWGRSKTVDIDATTKAAVPPSPDALVGIVGTKIRALVTAMSAVPGGGWQLSLHIGGDRVTSGVNAATRLTDGDFWLVPVPPPGPPPIGGPDTAPPTHPMARGRRPTKAA
ncbi:MULTISPECIES: hypothetical protein [unclassified Modestobacter]